MKASRNCSARAVHFRKVRLKRHCQLIEDYTEIIADLLETQKKVRICDIAREMGISHVSVIKTVKKLIHEGFLMDNIHPSIDLTIKGREMASFSKRKHLILSNFLLKLGIPEHIVATDVEGIEHYISPTTLKALEQHLKQIDSESRTS